MGHVPTRDADGVRRYGHFHPERMDRCTVQVARAQGRSTDFGQCDRKRGHGPGGAYCKQHAAELSEVSEVWYRVGRGSVNIKAVNVASSTSSTLMIIEGSRTARRELKSTQWANYFQTEEHAISHIRSCLESEVKWNEKSLAQANRELAAFTTKHPPTETGVTP